MTLFQKLRCWWTRKNYWYRLKCWLWHRYTTIKPRSLPHTWMDRDVVMEHCLFEILGQYLEKEVDVPNAGGTPEEGVLSELRGLWEWWNEVYLNPEFWHVEEGTPDRWKKIAELNKQMKSDLDQKLHRLLELRDHLWS